LVEDVKQDIASVEDVKQDIASLEGAKDITPDELLNRTLLWVVVLRMLNRTLLKK